MWLSESSPDRQCVSSSCENHISPTCQLFTSSPELTYLQLQEEFQQLFFFFTGFFLILKDGLTFKSLTDSITILWCTCVCIFKELLLAVVILPVHTSHENIPHNVRDGEQNPQANLVANLIQWLYILKIKVQFVKYGQNKNVAHRRQHITEVTNNCCSLLDNLCCSWLQLAN